MEKESGTLCSGKKCVKSVRRGLFSRGANNSETFPATDLESGERQVMEPASCLEMVEQE